MLRHFELHVTADERAFGSNGDPQMMQDRRMTCEASGGLVSFGAVLGSAGDTKTAGSVRHTFMGVLHSGRAFLQP
jgi:hypothetical protein